MPMSEDIGTYRICYGNGYSDDIIFTDEDSSVIKKAEDAIEWEDTIDDILTLKFK